MILEQVENLWPMLEFSWWNGKLDLVLVEGQRPSEALKMHSSMHSISLLFKAVHQEPGKRWRFLGQ